LARVNARPGLAARAVTGYWPVGILFAWASGRVRTQSSGSSGETATPGDAAAKAIGGVFGGFGGFGHKKKKKTEQEPTQPAQSSGSSEPPSLMEITSRVTSYSTDPVDSSLFAIPTGYKQVESPLQKDLERGH
jgi:hypothetical protein